MAVFMLETFKLSKTLKSSLDDFNVKHKNGKFTVSILDVKIVSRRLERLRQFQRL